MGEEGLGTRLCVWMDDNYFLECCIMCMQGAFTVHIHAHYSYLAVKGA